MHFYPNLPYSPHRAFAEPRVWQPMSDDEWYVLAPFVFRGTAGRPVENPRRRLDAIFWLAAQPSQTRWADLPDRFGKPDTVSRQFRRWAAAGVWTALLKALADRHYPGAKILAGMASWICRAYRRAWRLLGLGGIVLARRLGFLSALRGPTWLLPDPDLSVLAFREFCAGLLVIGRRRWRGVLTRYRFRSRGAVLRTAQGRPIPRALTWP